jgi:poly(A) polymerase/tRNA nucleotidyltransferase (CCA-adding enzyme)
MELLRESGMMQILLPELLEGYGLEQNRFHQYDVYYHNLASCDATAKLTDDSEVRIAALFHDIGKPQSLRSTGDNNTFYNHEVISYHKAKHILRRLRFSNHAIQKILLLVRNHMFHYTEEWTDGAVRRLMRKADPYLKELFILREGDRIGSGKKDGNSRIIEKLKRKIEQIIEEENALKIRDLAINGTDIMRIRKIPPSKEVGLVLETLLQKVLDNPSLNTKEDLEKLAAEIEITETTIAKKQERDLPGGPF